MEMELNSPGIRAPLDWRRVMDTAIALTECEEQLSQAQFEARRLRGLVERLGFECTKPVPSGVGDDNSACHCCQRRFYRLEGSNPPWESK